MLRAKKSLGQHFLIDKGALKRIADSANLQEGDTVIEIGPGTGLLTKELLETPLIRLIAYEIDDRSVELLRTEINDERFDVLHEDFLEANLDAYAKSPLHIVGNIPYYITSPIIFKLIDNRALVEDAVLLVQLEVAERLTAAPRTKAYGIPTVLANYFGEVTFLFKVKAGAFRPPPKVDSAVIRIDFRREYWVRRSEAPPKDFHDEDFRKLVRQSFGMRRKTLRNNLKGHLDTEILSKLEAAGFLSRRAEELSVEEFITMYSMTI